MGTATLRCVSRKQASEEKTIEADALLRVADITIHTPREGAQFGLCPAAAIFPQAAAGRAAARQAGPQDRPAAPIIPRTRQIPRTSACDVAGKALQLVPAAPLSAAPPLLAATSSLKTPMSTPPSPKQASPRTPQVKGGVGEITEVLHVEIIAGRNLLGVRGIDTDDPQSDTFCTLKALPAEKKSGRRTKISHRTTDPVRERVLGHGAQATQHMMYCSAHWHARNARLRLAGVPPSAGTAHCLAQGWSVAAARRRARSDVCATAC